MRESTVLENQLVKENDYGYAADPTLIMLSPKPKRRMSSPVDFSDLQNALGELEKSTDRVAAALAKSIDLKDPKLQWINQVLYQAEQHLLSDSGLPRRPWYRHTIYAPGFYTGYGVKTLPGIREAIEQRQWKEAGEQIKIAADALLGFARWIDTTENKR